MGQAGLEPATLGLKDWRDFVQDRISGGNGDFGCGRGGDF
jgi:hypothetical protein